MSDLKPGLLAKAVGKAFGISHVTDAQMAEGMDQPLTKITVTFFATPYQMKRIGEAMQGQGGTVEFNPKGF